MACLMGVDLGTSSLKVLIVSENGDVLSAGSRKYQFDMPVNGYAEQDPEVWWEACCQASREAMHKAGLKKDAIDAIGISGQMHGLVPLDAANGVIRPAILHCDARSAKQMDEINRVLGPEKIKEQIKNPVASGFWLPSLLWMRENEPEKYGKIRHAILPKDYLRYKMTGALASDYSDSSATLLFDLENMRWSDALVDAFSIPREILPDLYESTDVAGRLTPHAAEAMGVCAGTKVVFGGGDQNMQAIGNGVISDNAATITIGSSGQICFPITRMVKNPHAGANLFCGYRRNLWIAMGATLNAGMCLKWFTEILRETNWDVINEGVKTVPPGSGGLVFLPYLSGERYLSNAKLTGSFMGLSYATSRQQMARAVMEGVVYALYDCYRILTGMGLDVDYLVASGGGARSANWLSIQADVLNKPLRLTMSEEQASLGAAIAAGVGAGIFADVAEGCRAIVRLRDTLIEPKAENHQIYKEYYGLFRRAYLAQREVIEELTDLGRGRQ